MEAHIARRVQVLLTLAILVAAVYLVGVTWSFLSQFLGTFMLFFLAWLLAYLLKPLVMMITRTGLPFGVAVLLLYIIGPALLLLVGYLLAPAIMDQATRISSNLDEYTSKLSGLVDYARGALVSLGVSVSDLQELENKIRDAAGSVGRAVLQGGMGTVGSIGNELFRITLVLIFSISFLVDGDWLAGRALAAIPERWREGATLIVKSVERSFGSFVRGQLLSALAYALLTAGVMLAFGLPNVAISSLAAGLLIIAPLVGNYLAFIPPVVICLVARPERTLVLFLVLAIVQGIYMNLISPRIMAKAVNMHPLATTASILVFGQVGGFWGAFFGIPIASTIGMLARPAMHLVQGYLNPPLALVPGMQPQPPPLVIPQDNVANGVGEGVRPSRYIRKDKTMEPTEVQGRRKATTSRCTQSGFGQVDHPDRTPGDANPALAETEGLAEGRVSTADLLRARETGEAQLAGEVHDRDEGLVGRPHFHDAPVLPIVAAGYDVQEDVYDRDEMHTLDDEPDMHVFAPQMRNIPTDEEDF
jgi:predicted PurR-regulated permease PerM